MGRKRHTDSRFTFRADSEDIQWLTDYCASLHTNISQYLRDHIKALRLHRSGQREDVPMAAYAPDLHTLGLWHLTNAEQGGRGLHFDGSMKISVETNGVQQPTDGITVEAWVYPESLEGWRLICSQWGELLTGSYHLACVDGTPKFHISTETGLADVAGHTPLALRQWHHVAGMYDSEQIRLYVNGEEVGTRSHTGRLAQTDFEVVIGGKHESPACYNWVGRIVEVRLSAIARNPAEISPNRTGTQR